MADALILVVDDDPTIRAALAELLGYSGFRVATASNGAEGLKAIIEEEPSLVLLDWRMPVLDGRGFAAGLQQMGRPIPIALVTGEPNGATLADEIGAVASIPKPFRIEQLIPVIEGVLKAT